MPQLDFANPLTLSQVVWMAIIFAGLYLLLAKIALPRVAEVVESRTASIAADLAAAQAAKAKADEAVAQLKTAMAKAHSEAQTAVAQAIEQAQAAAAAESAVLNARLTEQLAAAEARIATARDAAMGALRQVAGDTTAALVARMTGQAPDQGRIDQAVGTALAARGQG